MSKNLAKSNMTKQKIKDSFMILYSKKSYYNITVNDIAAHAGLHRCTFYVYFENINEVLRDTEDELIKGMAEDCKKLRYIDIKENRLDPSSVKRAFINLYEYFRKNKFYMVTLMDPSSDQSFVRKFRKLIYDEFCVTLNNNHCSYGPNQDFILWYMSSGIIEVVYRWLKTDALTMDEIIEIMIKMMCFNPFLTLHESSI